MSLSTKLAPTLSIAILAVAGVSVYRILQGDAFGAYRHPTGGFDESVGVQMKGVQMNVYDKDKLVTQAKVAEIDVRRDRQLFDFKNVKGTVISTDNKVDFASQTASYDAISRALHFDQSVNVQNKDFNLVAPQLDIYEKTGLVTTKQTIKGLAYGGAMTAANLKYELKTGDFSTGKVKWKGTLPKVLQDGPITDAQKKTPWDFEAEEQSGKAGITHFKTLRATDGEILIRAEQGDWDRKKDILTCTGKVYYFSEKVNVVAEKVVIYRKERRAVLTGATDLRLLIKPKDQPNLTEEIPPFRPDVPDSIAGDRPTPPSTAEQGQTKDLDEAVRSPDNVRDYPAVVKCTEIEYWYGKGNRKAIIKGNPECLQDFPGGRWRRVSCKLAKYDGEAETLRLESEGGNRDVHMKTSIGDDFHALWMVVSVRDGQDDVQEWESRGAKGKFMANDEEVPVKEEKKGPPPTAG